MKTSLHAFMSHKFVNLFEDVSTFSIADTIKDSFSFICISTCRCNWVSSRQIISCDTPEHFSLESDPTTLMAPRKFLCLCLGQKCHVCGKRFVQPKIVPPFHGDKVAKPHVTQFMQHGVKILETLGKGKNLSAIKVQLIVSDATNIFHSTIVVFWNKNLIVFAEWVSLAKKFLVKAHTLFGNFEHFFEADAFL